MKNNLKVKINTVWFVQSNSFARLLINIRMGLEGNRLSPLSLYPYTIHTLSIHYPYLLTRPKITMTRPKITIQIVSYWF